MVEGEGGSFIPTAIFVVLIVAGFLVPALWSRVEGRRPGRQASFSKFMQDGIDTWGGHVSGRGALVQVLIMPVMSLCWAVIIAIIRASVCGPLGTTAASIDAASSNDWFQKPT